MTGAENFIATICGAARFAAGRGPGKAELHANDTLWGTAVELAAQPANNNVAINVNAPAEIARMRS